MTNSNMVKADLKEWALDTDGWMIYGKKSNKKYSIEKLNPETDADIIFYSIKNAG